MRKYFSEDYVNPSPKLTEHQEKRSSPEIELFFFFFLPKLGEEPPKKRSSPEIEVFFFQNLVFV